MGLTARILIGMAAGLFFGTLLGAEWVPGSAREVVVDGILRGGGTLFLSALKLLVVPLVFVSLACGTAALDDITKLGRVGLTTLVLYLGTTAAAISLALMVGRIFQPGSGFELTSSSTFQPGEQPGIVDTLLGIVPDNVFRAMADGNMLQVIFFAGLFGVALSVSGESGRRVLAFLRDVETAVMSMVTLVMAAAPIGVFCLVAQVFAVEGTAALLPLAGYFLCVLAALFLHAFVTYPALLRFAAGMSPRRFLASMRPVLAVAFGTASSNATLPLTLETVQNEFGVDESIAAFTVPLGATVNMDGTAIMQGVATAFIAQAYGVDLSVPDYLMVVLTATLASIGTAGVPGVGLVTLAMVLRQVHLPVEGIALVLGVDRLLDMVRTAVNVCGDATVTCVVARRENALHLPGEPHNT